LLVFTVSHDPIEQLSVPMTPILYRVRYVAMHAPTTARSAMS
jgi:hypothetical protein